MSYLNGQNYPIFHQDINVYSKQYVDILYSSLVLPDISFNCSQGDDSQLSRWSRLLKENDYKGIWRAINWKGEIESASGKNDKPPGDIEFKTHFEKLLNPQQDTT